MNITCYPSTLSGTVAAIPSKSDAHRKLICAALSDNGCFLPIPAPFCDDIAATVRCLQALGATVKETDGGVAVSPIRSQTHADLNCGESGSTLRFLLPVAMTVCRDVHFTGSGRLPDRPIDALTEAMSLHGVQFDSHKLPLTATGTLTGGQYEIAGNISSQFLSGLLMALPLCDSDSEIHLTTALQSSAYVDMTLDSLRLFGAKINVNTENSLNRYNIKSVDRLHAPDCISIDGDWSNAAFWLVAGAIQNAVNTSVAVSGLNSGSIQGDSAIESILRDAGACLTRNNSALSVVGGHISAMQISMESIPDLLPILAVLAAFADGESHFVNAERLRLKESDRLQSVSRMLSSLGRQVVEYPDGLTVMGGGLSGGVVDAQNDHRLVMAAAIAALRCKKPVTILGAEAVNKSYPSFFMDYIALGGIAKREA